MHHVCDLYYIKAIYSIHFWDVSMSLNFFTVFLLVSFLTSAGCTQKSKVEPLSPRVKIAVENFNVDAICQIHEGACIYGDQALRELYGVKDKPLIESVNNVATLGRLGLVQVIYSAKFNDGTDDYAVFLTQFNRYDEDGNLSTCHSCAALLGMIVYQYHNSWKIFAKNMQIDQFGSWGTIKAKLESKKSSINIYKSSSESFILTLEESFLFHGIAEEYLNIIKFNGISGDSIAKIGNIKIGYRDGNLASSDTLDWAGKVDVAFSNDSSYPIIKLTKIYMERYEDKPSPKNTPKVIEYMYEGSVNKYLEKTKF